MQKKLLTLSNQMEEFVSWQLFESNTSRSRRAKRMEQLLDIAMRVELTERQKTCIRLYFFENQKVCDIAAALHIRPTTVYKHLKVARMALRKCANYLKAESF